jgi:dTDP-4-dehydrorhamnose reductase
MKVALLGAAGQLGSHLLDVLSGSNEVVALTRKELDLAEISKIEDTLEAVSPNLVINAAAYTAVDRAEDEVGLARRINAEAPGVVARYCSVVDIPLIHYSTDYVFDGSSTVAYLESDEPAPMSVYGETKLAGETAVLEAHEEVLVLRTSWVYSYRGSNFYRTMLRLSGERDELNVVADQYGAPTYAGSIADATVELVRIAEGQGGLSPHQCGVFHLTCSGKTSWHGFAQSLLQLNGVMDTRVNAILTSEYPTPAARPSNSVLDNSRLRDVFDIEMPDWEKALKSCIADGQLA